jgi:hypothetical protein
MGAMEMIEILVALLVVFWGFVISQGEASP